MKKSRKFLTFFSFLITMGVYLLYAHVLVPILFPAIARQTINPYTTQVLDQELLGTVFEKGSWVLEKHGRIDIGNEGTLRFGNLKPAQNGQVRLYPIAVLFFPTDTELSQEERYRQAIIMEANEAIVEYAGELMGQPQLQRGTLVGKVTIRSAMKLPDKSDDLWAATQDIQFDQQFVTTNKPVEFRYGANHGSGSGLTIELGNKDAPRLGTIANKTPDTIKRIDLKPPVDMTFYFDTGQGKNQGTVQLMSKGSMELVPDAERVDDWYITFKESVDVHRINAEGASDKLVCTQLQFLIGPKRDDIDMTSYNNTFGGSTSNQVLYKVDAIGYPVSLLSPENKNLEIKSDHIIMDPINNQITVTRQSRDADPVTVKYDSMVLTGNGIYYAFVENDAIGKLDIDGAGMIKKTALVPGKDQAFQLKWKDNLNIFPDKDKKNMTCVQIRGNLELDLPNIGSMTADEASIWCEQVADETSPTASRKPGDKKTTLLPSYALIKKNVHLKTTQGECLVDEMEIWFKRDAAQSAHHFQSPIRQVAYTPVQNQRTTTTTKGSVLLGSGILGDGASDGKTRYTIRADKMQIDARMVGNDPVIDQIILKKNININENQLTATGEQPIHLTGQQMHIWYPGSSNTVIEIHGDNDVNASFKGRGMTLNGTNLNIDQKTNKIWMIGQGQLKVDDVDLAKAGAGSALGNLIPGTSASTSPSSGKGQAIIKWLGNMQFDGKIISFNENVDVYYPLGSIRNCDVLQIILNNHINFFDSQNTQPIGVNRIVVKGLVDLDHDSFSKTNPNQQVSREHIRFNSIEINPNTGDFLAYGPGYVSATFLSDGVGSSLTTMGQSVPPKTVSTTASGAGAGQLYYLHVRFQKSVTGNFTSKKLSFNERVRCVFHPVRSFTENVNIDDTRTIIAQGAILSCDDSLVIVDASLPNSNTNSYVITANGKATIEKTINGDIYEGVGERMRFDQGKNTVLLEGGTYTPALLSRKSSYNAISETLVDKRNRFELNIETAEFRTY